jgi:hypothetical protein
LGVPDGLEHGRFVIAGLVPAISIRRAQCADYRDGRDKPGHDQVGTATRLASVTKDGWTRLNLLAFSGGVRFAKMPGAGRAPFRPGEKRRWIRIRFRLNTKGETSTAMIEYSR